MPNLHDSPFAGGTGAGDAGRPEDADDLRDLSTEVGLPTGRTLDLGDSGAYLVDDLLHSSTRSRTMLYAATVTRQPDHAATMPERVVLKRYRDRPGPAAVDLPANPLLMLPLLRVPPNRSQRAWLDVMPAAETDLAQLWVEAGAGESDRRLATDLVLSLAVTMAAAVAAANHGRDGEDGYVHGDIKLEQFLLGPAGVQLTDFDHAEPYDMSRYTDDSAAEGTTTVGMYALTYDYLPPWGRAGRSSPRYDAWALLVCWHRLLTGQHPAETYAGGPLSARKRVDATYAGEWSVSTAMDDWWYRFLSRHMHAEPDDRPTAATLRDELIEAMADATSNRWRENVHSPTPISAVSLPPERMHRYLVVTLDPLRNVTSTVEDTYSPVVGALLERQRTVAALTDDLFAARRARWTAEDLATSRHQELDALHSELDDATHAQVETEAQLTELSAQRDTLRAELRAASTRATEAERNQRLTLSKLRAETTALEEANAKIRRVDGQAAEARLAAKAARVELAKLSGNPLLWRKRAKQLIVAAVGLVAVAGGLGGYGYFLLVGAAALDGGNLEDAVKRLHTAADLSFEKNSGPFKIEHDSAERYPVTADYLGYADCGQKSDDREDVVIFEQVTVGNHTDETVTVDWSKDVGLLYAPENAAAAYSHYMERRDRNPDVDEFPGHVRTGTVEDYLKAGDVQAGTWADTPPLPPDDPVIETCDESSFPGVLGDPSVTEDIEPGSGKTRVVAFDLDEASPVGIIASIDPSDAGIAWGVYTFADGAGPQS